MLKDDISGYLSDLVDGIEDLAQVIRTATKPKPEKKAEAAEEPEPIDPKLLDLIATIGTALTKNTETLAGIAGRQQPAAPVVKVAAPVVNIEPANITIPAQPPQPKCGFTCRITRRDALGHIEEFTLTPTN